MNIVFWVVDEEGFLFLDFKDLWVLMIYVGENVKEFFLEYGCVLIVLVGVI